MKIDQNFFSSNMVKSHFKWGPNKVLSKVRQSNEKPNLIIIRPPPPLQTIKAFNDLLLATYTVKSHILGHCPFYFFQNPDLEACRSSSGQFFVSEILRYKLY